MAEKTESGLSPRAAGQDNMIPTVYSNYGLARLNWTPSLTSANLVVIAGATDSDSVLQFVEAIRRLGDFDLRIAEDSNTGEIEGDWFNQLLREPNKAPILASFSLTQKHVKALERSGLAVRIIYLFDDPCSLALNAERSASRPVAALLHSKATELGALATLASKNNLPSIAVSVAKARMRADVAATTLADFLGISPTDAKLRAAQYFIDDRAPFERNILEEGLSVQGALNRVQRPGAISGWARIPLSAERLYVMIRTAGIPIADGLAELYRHDLDAHKIGDGKHGFTIPVDGKLSPEMQEFEVVVPQYDFLIGRIRMSDSDVQTPSE
ncbi:MAG: hypothetical protein AAF437_03735 [Pseudomonadota bacterium]